MLKLTLERVGAMLPLPVPALNPRVEVWRDNEGLISAYGEVLDDEYRMHLPGLATFRFTCHAEEISAFVANGAQEHVVIDAYFRKVLPMVLQVRGREVLHASAVLFPAGIVALCGVSQTGKSTLAFALSRRSHPLWADDSVVLEVTDSTVTALSLPFNVRLRPAAAEHFDHSPRTSAFISGDPADSDFTETAPLAAVCVLRRTSETVPLISVRRLSSAEAFASVLTHAYCFTFEDPERKRRMMNNYLNLVERIPIFDVCFTPGLSNLPGILERLEDIGAEITPPCTAAPESRLAT